MNFFKNFPLVPVDIKKDGRVMQMVNTFRSVRPLQNFIDQPSLYTFYNIKNGERPDIVSQRLYGTQEYYWTFFVINEFLHDGYRSWPMSQEVLHAYLDDEYNGTVITTRPDIERDSDGGIQEFTNSLAGENRNFSVTDATRYKIDETVTGSVSGASGKLVKKNMDLNQLVIKEVTNGPFVENELITGQLSGASVSAYQVYKYADAPHHYHLVGDKEERYITPSFMVSDDAVTLYGPDVAIPSNNYEIKTNRQYINTQNESRSRIRVLQPDYIGQFVEEFEKLINA